MEIEGLFDIYWGVLLVDDDGLADVVMYGLQLQVKSWSRLGWLERSHGFDGKGERVHVMMISANLNL